MKKISLFFIIQLLINDSLFCMQKGSECLLSHNASLNNLSTLIQEGELFNSTEIVRYESRGRLGLHRKSASYSFCSSKNSKGVLRKNSMSLIAQEKQKNKTKIQWKSATQSKFFRSLERGDCLPEDNLRTLEGNFFEDEECTVSACYEIDSSDEEVFIEGDKKLSAQGSSFKKDFEESRESIEGAFALAKKYKKLELLEELRGEVAQQLCEIFHVDDWLFKMHEDIKKEIELLQEERSNDCSCFHAGSQLTACSNFSEYEYERFVEQFMEPYVAKALKINNVEPLVKAKSTLEALMYESLMRKETDSDESLKQSLVLAYLNKNIPLFEKKFLSVKKKLKPLFETAQKMLSVEPLIREEERLNKQFKEIPLDNKDYSAFFYAIIYLRSSIPELQVDFLKQREFEEKSRGIQESLAGNQEQERGSVFLNESLKDSSSADAISNNDSEDPFEVIYKDAVEKGNEIILGDLVHTLDAESDLYKRAQVAIETIKRTKKHEDIK